MDKLSCLQGTDISYLYYYFGHVPVRIGQICFFFKREILQFLQEFHLSRMHMFDLLSDNILELKIGDDLSAA